MVAPYGLTAPLNLRVEAGCVHGILGPNGAGKSTAIRLLAGLLKPVSGGVFHEGKALARLSAIERARRVAYVPQQTDLTQNFTGRQVVTMGRFPWRQIRQDDGAAVDEALSLLDVIALAERPVTALSGGEQQRICIARALAQQTPVLLLDEPTAHLDAGRRVDLLRRLTAESRAQTVVMTLHDLNLAALFCDRISLLSEGKIIAEGPPSAVMTQALISDTFGADLRRVPGEVPQFLPVA